MDNGADALARRAQRFGKAPAAEEGVGHVDEEARLAELIQLRAQERKECEQEGVLSTGKTRLEEAKDLVGICPGMISEYQYLWRKLRYNNIHSLEKDEHGVPQWYLTIKDYARSAAGNEQELPSDVRPPDVLLRTTDYILSHLLSTHPFNAVNQAFIRDRARAIVKDFTMQHVRNAPAIEAHERIVRMAAISMHVFRDQRQPDGPFDHDGERKQFVNALSSLTQFYTDSRTPTLPKTFISQTHTSPNEPELQSFWHLFSIRRPPTDALPDGVTNHPLFRLARKMIKLWDQSVRLVKEAEGMLLSPSERAAKERAESMKGVHRFKRPTTPDPQTAETETVDDGDWKPQRFNYPPTFAFPALALLRLVADPGVPWLLAAVLEASALDELRARALWEIWQVRRGGDVTVLELVDQLGFDTPEDVRMLVDTIAESSGRNVRRLRPKGTGAEVKAYRLVGSMKFPTHYPKVGRNIRLIDSKRPAGLELAQIVNQSWEKSTNDYDLPLDDIPDLVFPDRVGIEPADTQPKPGLSRLESSRVATPANGGAGGVFAGFGTADKPGNVFGQGKPANVFGEETKPGNVFGETKSANLFGETKASNPFGGFGTNTETKSNPFGGSSGTSTSFGVPSANPFGKPATSTSTSNPFGSSNSSSGFGAGATAFGAGASAFGAGSSVFGGSTTTFGAGSNTFGAGSNAFTTSKPAEPKPAEPPKPKTMGSPSASKLSPFAASFVPKFALTGSLPVPAPAPKPVSVESQAEDETHGEAASENEAARLVEEEARAAEEEAERARLAKLEAAKAAREAKLRDKLEAARREEEARKKKAEEELARRQAEEARRRAAEEQRRLEAEQKRLAEEQAQLEAERQRQLRIETLHSTTAELLFSDVLEILIVPEVQYAIRHEKQGRVVLAKAFEHWKFRAAKRIKRRRVLENMGLGRVGVAGAAEEVGELFDEDESEEERTSVVPDRRRTSFREERSDAELAAALAKATAERERLWAPGVFLDIIRDTVTSAAEKRDKTLEEIPGWDVWLCTSGANKSSAEWLRKKLNARPTALVDGTVSIAPVTPKAQKKESAPGLVVFECSPHLGAAMNDQEWNDAWSGEANRIARLFSAMSNHASYAPSLVFILWSTDHVTQHSEAITRKLKQAASHLADVSMQGEPAVAVLVDETVEEVFQEALDSLELDVGGHQVVERTSVTESLSKQISIWHQSLSSVLSKLPTFDDEESITHIAHVISLFLKLFNVITAGVIRLAAPHLEHSISLPDFTLTSIHDNKALYNLADSYTASLTFCEAVDLNVLRTSLRQARHSSRPFPARFFCERVAQLVDIALTPSISGNRPRSEVTAVERTFEGALQESLNALEARPKKRVQPESPTRDTKKARLAPSPTPANGNGHPIPEPASEVSGAAKLRAILAKTRNRWAESDNNDL